MSTTVSSRFFSLEEYAQRWHRVQQAMQQRGLDLVVVWSRSAGTYDRCADLLYLANYYGNQPGQGRNGPQGFSAVVLQVGQTPELFADMQDLRHELIATDRVQACSNTFEAVAHRLAAAGSRKVGLVGTDLIPMKYWSRLQALTPQVQWVIADDLVREVRLIKSARELEAFRCAGKTASAAITALAQALIAGRSQAEAAGEAARQVTRGGGHVHQLAISHGAQLKHLASDPVVGYNQQTPAADELARAWVTGPMFQGYWLGPGRTVVCGAHPSPPQRALLEANAEAVSTVLAAVRAGVKVHELVAIGDRLTAQFGGEPSDLTREWPVYGHGNGLFFEAPSISVRVGPDAEFVLRENMVISVEMFFARDGVGQAGFENSVIVTRDGSELLITSPMLFE
jgi:Xaa-Pro aminopeptidase